MAGDRLLAPVEKGLDEAAHVRAPVFLGQFHRERDPAEYVLIIAGHGSDLEGEVDAFQPDPLDVDTSIVRGVLDVAHGLIAFLPKDRCIFAVGIPYSCAGAFPTPGNLWADWGIHADGVPLHRLECVKGGIYTMGIGQFLAKYLMD